jgi:hypothetical protein
MAGFSAALADNAFGTSFLNYNAPSDIETYEAKANWNAGVQGGNAASMALAVMEGAAGKSLMAGGGLMTVSVVGAEVGVPATLVGGGMTLHSFYFFANALNNTIKGAGLVKYESEIELPKSGETNATKTGREAHDNYQPGAEYKVDRKDTGLENGKFPDAVDDVNDIVRELKPNNKRKIREGEKQVRGYADQLEKQTGRKFKTVVDTYDIMPDGTIKYTYGTPK